jgi:RNAse (barnase) inhibitor barstar
MKSFQHNLIINEHFLAFLDAENCKNRTDFFNEIANALLFPDYFNHNLDSFDECMNDLSWIEQTSIKLLIFNYDKFLIDDLSLLKIVQNIFSNAIIELDGNQIQFTVFKQLNNE